MVKLIQSKSCLLIIKLQVVVAEGLQPKLLVSSTIVDFGSQIVLNERVKKIPYTMEITFTNSDVQPLEWVLGKPQSVLPPGSKNIFKVTTLMNTLRRFFYNRMINCDFRKLCLCAALY